MIRSIFSISLLFILAACTAGSPTTIPTEAPATDEMDNMENMDEMGDMGGMGSVPTGKYAPTVDAYYDGGDILFIHTEVSDPDISTLLTEMMNGPLVVLVPELADTPDNLLANVYVFTNGLDGLHPMGPFGFQPDIFDSVPGDEAYRPLRRINLVEWADGADVRELKTVADLFDAEAAGELAITQPGIVVNMPVLVWPGGSR